MAEIQITQSIENPVYAALTLMLTHLAISQPEVAKETKKIKAALDDHFSPANQWKAPEPGLTEAEVSLLVDQKLERFAVGLQASTTGKGGGKS